MSTRTYAALSAQRQPAVQNQPLAGGGGAAGGPERPSEGLARPFCPRDAAERPWQGPPHPSPSSQAHGLCGTCSIRPSVRAASDRPRGREGKSTLSTSRNTIRIKFISPFLAQTPISQITTHTDHKPVRRLRLRKSPLSAAGWRSHQRKINWTYERFTRGPPHQPAAITGHNRISWMKGTAAGTPPAAS